MMEMNKRWTDADYRALVKRINYAAGMIEDDSEEIRNVALSCQLFLRFYEAKTAEASTELPKPVEKFIVY
jgi:hypothetical protein